MNQILPYRFYLDCLYSGSRLLHRLSEWVVSRIHSARQDEGKDR